MKTINNIKQDGWESAINSIVCADCFDLLGLIPDKSIDCVLMDPPYGVNLGKNSKFKYDKFEDTPENVIKLVNNILKECFRVSDLVVMTPGNTNLFEYPKPTHVGSLFFPHGTGMNNWGFTCWQPIYFYGNDPYLEKRMGSRPDSLCITDIPQKNGHPCPKGIKQWQWLVKRTSFQNQLILDPFMGSWTTAVACKSLNRNFIGCDISEEYCKIGEKRLKSVFEIKENNKNETII
jgi:DNA modification methylase